MTRGAAHKLLERSQCPCCGSSSYSVLLRESYGSPALQGFLHRQYEGRADAASLTECNYELVRCQACSMSYQRTVPADALLMQIYEEWIPPSERDRLHRERDLNDYVYMAEQVQFLVQQLQRRPYQISVLDFGMGWAEWASMARAFGCQVAGSELSQHRIDNARSIGIEVVDWDEIPRRKFDFINTEQVFEHLIEPRPVLEHLKNGLGENGIVRIAVPDSRVALKKVASNRSFGKLSPEHVVPVQPLEHVNSFDNHSLISLASRVGLQLVKPSLRYLYHSSSGWLSPKNALRLAARPIFRHVYPGSTILYFKRAA